MRVGVFDSGRGGAFACKYFCDAEGGTDTILFSDTENAPYGNKTEAELVRLLSNGIERLASLGCERVLIACCTASTVYKKLSYELAEISIPIIEPTAREACLATSNNKIAVVSTEATRRSGAFLESIGGILPHAEVISISSPLLVKLAEGGVCDNELTDAARAELERVIKCAEEFSADTLVLGCTHYAAFEKTAEKLSSMHVINSARIGAEVLRERIKKEK